MVLRRLKLSVALLVFLSQVFSQDIVINEFHAMPVSGQIEFVELLNVGSSTIDIGNWLISDAGTGKSIPSTNVNPGEYVVLASDSLIYSKVPIGTHYLKPSGGLPSLNNSGDRIKLSDSFGTVIDSLIYDSNWDVVYAFSTEKIQPNFKSNVSTNWKTSKDSLGTPGAPNSVTPIAIDGAIEDGITFTPTFPNKNDNVVAIVPILNAGLNNISGTLTATINGNIVGTNSVSTLMSQQSRNIYISIPSLPSGRYNVYFELTVAGDGDLANNTANKKLSISYEEGAIRINEFHAEPGAGQIEFIELVASRSIVIDGWHIADKSSSKLLPTTYLEKDDYVIIASDTSLKAVSNPNAKYLIPYGGLPTLNNSGDNIYLKDMNHTIIDSLVYGSGWPIASDTSTEKLRPDLISNDPLNWKKSTAALGMTPGYINSNYLIAYDGEVITDNIFTIPQFPKNNEQIQLNIPITNHGADPISGTLNVYDENNIVIQSTSISNIARRDTNIFTFNLQALPSGIHPIQIDLDINDDGNLSNNSATDTIFVSYNFGDVLMNEFLAAPTSAQAEFVELYAFKNIDFYNWSIEDATRNPKMFSSSEITGNQFIVLSEDLAFSSIIPSEAIFIEVEDFPSLNNYGDAIYLKDFTGMVIDSLIYTTWWELESGKSTEKIHPSLVSKDSINWKVSTDSTGMTPGRSNSVAAKNIDGAILSELITNTPQYPANDENIQLTIPIANVGLQTFSGELVVEYNNEVLENYSIDNITAGDTQFYSLELEPLSSGIHSISIQLNIDNDENIDNNSTNYEVKISYDFGDVTINEFLADPEAPLFEFVELYTLKDIEFYNWSISDNRREPISFGNDSIDKNKYIVICEDFTLDLSLPEYPVVYTINNFPSLNNSGDGIYLYDFTGKIIDSLNYDNTTWPIKNGVSTEKLFPSYISNDATRWKTSTNPSGTTIGQTNSVLLQNINGTIVTDLASHYPEFPHPSESISFNIAVKNTGLNTISGDVSINQNDIKLGTASFTDLVSEEVTFINFNIEPLQSGNNNLEILLNIPDDMNSSDNQMDYDIYVSYPFGKIVINEFLAKPDTSQAEFVEIISFSDIDLSGWSISDNTLKHYYFDEYFASANDLIVITSDSLFVATLPTGIPFIIPSDGWPTLNNESDGIYLYDVSGNVIDSLNYNSDWPLAEARSTEKYRPDFESNSIDRWGIAVNSDAMTPGQENSLYFDELPDKGTIAFEANPFSPDGDGVDDELLIKYKLPFEQGIIKLKIFDMTGRNIATPYWNVYFPQEGILRWDGKIDNGNIARIGIYIIKLSAKDASSNNTWEKVKTVVLAKKL